MNNNATQNSIWLREELLHLLSLSGTLAGLCITGVTLFHTLRFTSNSVPATIADDALLISAVLFLLCTYIIFVALRTKRSVLTRVLEKIADALFMVALTAVTSSGFVMLYTGW